MKREQLIKTRKSAGKTQADMAIEAGIHRSYYGLIENGNRNPTLGIATKIATALDSNIEQLFPDDIFFLINATIRNNKTISIGDEDENGN